MSQPITASNKSVNFTSNNALPHAMRKDKLEKRPTVASTSATATITGLQMLNGSYYTHTVAAPATLTLPTGAVLAAALAAAPFKITAAAGMVFDFFVHAAGSSTSTVTAGATGSTVKGTAAVASGSIAKVTVMFTGAATYIAYVDDTA